MTAGQLLQAISAAGTPDHCWHVMGAGEIVKITAHPVSVPCPDVLAAARLARLEDQVRREGLEVVPCPRCGLATVDSDAGTLVACAPCVEAAR